MMKTQFFPKSSVFHKKPQRLIFLFILLVFAPVQFAAADSIITETDGWQVVAEGIEYQKFHLTTPRPIDVFVTRMAFDSTIPTYNIIDTSIALGKNSGGIETVRDQASRSDQAVNNWGGQWGNRNDVVAAINGYFFDNQSASPTYGVPWSGQLQSGWYTKRFDDRVGDAGFVWLMTLDPGDGLPRVDPEIESCVYHVEDKQYVLFQNDSLIPYLDAVNITPDGEDLILYTPQFDATTQTSSADVLEILVEMTKPAGPLLAPGALGYIREIRDQQGSTPIPFDHVVLSAWGSQRTAILAKINQGTIAVGDQIGFAQKIKDCDEPRLDWQYAYSGMAGDYHFINHGVIRTDFHNSDAYVPNARTAIAHNHEYIFFIVVDRWNPGVSEGMTIAELASFADQYLYASASSMDAVTMDSGGSATMVVNGVVVNNTTCNFSDCRVSTDETPYWDAPEIYRISPDLYVNTTEGGYGLVVDQLTGTIEPLVANGILMVKVEPKEQSLQFSDGESVTLRANAEVRLGPGTNFAGLDSQPMGAVGTIQNPLNPVNGVLAKGAYWWKVNFGNVIGWLEESHLWGSQNQLYFPLISR